MGFSPRGRTFYPALLLATILTLALPAAAKSWRVSNFQDTITVNSDGSALVNETITLKFVGEWHGIHRTIPIEYPGPNGTNYQLFVDCHQRHRRKRTPSSNTTLPLPALIVI